MDMSRDPEDIARLAIVDLARPRELQDLVSAVPTLIELYAAVDLSEQMGAAC